MTPLEIGAAIDTVLADVEFTQPIQATDCAEVRDMIDARGVRAEVYHRNDHVIVRALVPGVRVERVVQVPA